MNYAEMILFIAKSLTISSDIKNFKEVKDAMKYKNFNWDLFVKISTSELILPALYCNYKRLNLLKYLPEELVTYMKYITDCNRDRNQKIITQAHKINNILLSEGITPIFLKGTSNLLQDFYEDSAERMVGDIDFLVSADQYQNTIEVLLSDKYESVSKSGYNFPIFKHYPRLIKKDEIAAVEIHKEMLVEKYSDEFDHHTIKNDIIHSKGFYFLGFNHQKALSIFSSQINDKGYVYKSINLKSAYDVLLLSKKSSDINFITQFNKLQKPINCFLITSHYLFGKIDSINFNQSKYAKNYLNSFKKLLYSPRRRKINSKAIRLKIFIEERLKIIFKSFVNKEYRIWLFKRLSDKNWQREKLVQLKLKKPLQ